MGLATTDLLFIHNPAESQLALVGRQEFMRVRAPCGGGRAVAGAMQWQSLM